MPHSAPLKRTTLEMWRVELITDARFIEAADATTEKGPLESLDHIVCHTEKVCDWNPPLPNGVSIIRAEVSAAHVTWAALCAFNAPPPYLIVTACSDGCLRFWRCDASSDLVTNTSFVWSEWQMPLAHALSSSIELEDSSSVQVLDIDCAYSGRVAVAYTRHLVENTGRTPGHPPVSVSIYECESSGGCEWLLEDTIQLGEELREFYSQGHHTKVPPIVQLDWVSTEDGRHLLSIMLGPRVLVFAAMCQNLLLNDGSQLSHIHHHVHHHHHQVSSTLMTSMGEVFVTWRRVATAHVYTNEVLEAVPTVPVGSIVQPLACGRQRRAVWLRDGLLVIGMSAEMHVYSQWPCESSTRQTLSSSDSTKTTQNPSAQPVKPSDISSSENSTLLPADEMTVSGSASMTVAQLTRTYSAYLLKQSPSTAMLLEATAAAKPPATPPEIPLNPKENTDSGPAVQFSTNDSALLANLGLFESIQVLNPVLPQFHPRQLLEWLNLGRLRRVQVILAHLTRCLANTGGGGAAGGTTSIRTSGVSRTQSQKHRQRQPSSSEMPTFLSDSVLPRPSSGNELTSTPSLLEAETIPPVPLYVLLAVDSLHSDDLVTGGTHHKETTVFDPNDEVTSSSPFDEAALFRIETEPEALSDDSRSTLSELDSRESRKKSSRPDIPSVSCKAMSMWSLDPDSLVALVQFRPEDARLLTEHLTTRQLPGLSPLDQMYLLGIADLMANTQNEVTERLSGVRSKARTTKTSFSEQRAQRSQGLDECGLRFLLTVQLYSYLSRTLPPARRVQLLSTGLTNASLVWAFHSEAEEELLGRIPVKDFAHDCEELTWVEFRRYGCGWWIRSDAVLRRCAEKMARNAFQATKDPMESVLFYLAMHKPKVVAGLFKSIGNRTLENFFRSDFEPGRPACRQAKLNAFRLLSQHKYEQAAGLFLLAGCLEDALRVCLDSLKDLQLAVVTARLYTSTVPGLDPRSEDSPYRMLLRQHIVCHEDPFLRSMAFWILGEPLNALQTLLEGSTSTATTDSMTESSSSQTSTPTVIPSHGSVVGSPQHPQSLEHKPELAGSRTHSSFEAQNKRCKSVYPNVFKFYTFLRTHPLVIRQWRLRNTSPSARHDLCRLTCLERRLYFRTAHHYSALGCPTLALEVLSKLPSLTPVTNASKGDDSINEQPQKTRASLAKEEPKKSSTNADFFAWSSEDPFEQLSKRAADDELKLQWSDDEEAVKLTSDSDDLPTPVDSRKGSDDENDMIIEEGSGVVDLIANQLKFIACLKILSEELSTLAAGAEFEGAGLRQHVWQWLEQELAVVRALTTPTNSALSDTSGKTEPLPSKVCLMGPPLDRSVSLTIDPQHLIHDGPLTKPSLSLTVTPCPAGPVQQSEPYQSSPPAIAILPSLSTSPPGVREAERNRLYSRYQWLKAHETFLTSLINYCGLYGASGVGLSAVRIELLLLLTELHTSPAHLSRPTDSSPHQDHMSSAQSTTVALVDGIPLLRTILHLPPGVLLLPDPVRLMQYMIQDLVSCLETLPPPYMTTAILPYPMNGVTIQPGSPYCGQCAWAPTPHRERRVFLLRNLCAALAGCVHQLLSTGGWFGSGHLTMENGVVQSIALPATGSATARSVERLFASKQLIKPNTEPGRWPALSSLQKYIRTHSVPAREHSAVTTTGLEGGSIKLQSINRHFLVGLLGQALATTYLGLIVYALHTRDACALYRLAHARLDGRTWGRVFGGALRLKPFRPPAPTTAADSSSVPGEVANPQSSKPARPGRPSAPTPPSESLVTATTRPRHTSLAREHAQAAQEIAAQASNVPADKRDAQRMRLLANAAATSIANASYTSETVSDAPVHRPAPAPPDEWFVPPQCSMLSCLLERPSAQGAQSDDPSALFDSDNSEPPDDYVSYAKATASRQRRIRRANRRMQGRMNAERRQAQRKAKEDLKRRLARHTKSSHSDEEDTSVVDARDSVANVDSSSSSSESSSDVAEDHPRWVLRLLYLDPDMSDALFSYSLELERKTTLFGLTSELSTTEDEDDDDDAEREMDRIAERQWAHGDSYSWRLIRLGIMHLANGELTRLTKLLDFGSDDLAVYAPGLVTATRLADIWMTNYRRGLTAPPTFTPRSMTQSFDPTLDSHHIPPIEFIPGVQPDLTVSDTRLSSRTEMSAEISQQMPSNGAVRAMSRLRHLMDPSKTPFQTRDPFSLPTKRLWCYLVRQPILDDMFVRHIFRQPRPVHSHVVPNPLNRKDSVQPDRSPSTTHLLQEDTQTKSTSAKSSRSQPTTSTPQPSSSDVLFDDAIRLIHKEQNPLIAMCVNQVNQGCIAVATPKEIIELDIDNLISLPPWYADEIEYDCELMRKPRPHNYSDRENGDDFVVLDALENTTAAPSGPVERTRQSNVVTTGGPGPASAHVMLKRTIASVFSLASHPTLPYYLCGTDTGSIHLFEWATAVPVIASFANTFSLTSAGAAGHVPAGSRGARVTALHFDTTGHRFGCGDADGNFGLWNLQSTTPDKPPYFRCHCHAKGLSDFCFVGSSSLVATVGNGGGTLGGGPVGGTEAPAAGGVAYSIDQNAANLTLWDTLLPPRRCGVILVTDPEIDSPCTSIAYLPPSTSLTGWPTTVATDKPSQTESSTLGGARNRTVIVGTKKGDVCTVDLRQSKVVHKFSAHESAVRTLRVDPSTDCLITGGADGIVKVWRLTEHELITSLSSDFYQGRGPAAFANLLRGNQSAAIIAATNPGIAQIHLLPLTRGAPLILASQQTNTATDTVEYVPHASDTASQAAACRFLSCSADGGLRMRSLVIRPRPFKVY